MKRIRLIVAYDGTGYCGWQIQPNGITVEEVINRGLSRLLAVQIRECMPWEMWLYLIQIRVSRQNAFPMH